MNDTKLLIFESAIKVFSNKGYKGATMDEIAYNAGVAKGTLYYHFKSKEEIFKYIIIEGMHIIKEEMEYNIKLEKDPLKILKILCKVQLNLINKNKDFIKVIMSQLWGSDNRQLELRQYVQEYIMYTQKYIQHAIDCGVIKNGKASFMAYNFFGLLCSVSLYEIIDNENNDIDELMNKIMEYIFNGILNK
ncbi:fatty acid metabolism regulator protein [Clostridium acetireducens DSM 10703]|jgi:TetR/AcrR family transcriptional regulator|uniref:Fatty acid metabolism regulator protein n=1 Tax=Clostridium acetireducens DSM 10703 TaxID=1121290 RepID=A0A1E8EWU5_9CLOT|nr:TetR/AcrR family transcriptional regulator [Clostridium acetireducens]OFI04986.1 fatty acid metabolism regulator protein [Clostridium acetireducens DSM 10703]